jgi:hypothetical protein
VTPLIDAITALIVILLGVQIWLLSATLDAYLAGHSETAVAGAVISGLLCGACFGMYLFLRRIDARAAHDRNGGPRVR